MKDEGGGERGEIEDRDVDEVEIGGTWIERGVVVLVKVEVEGFDRVEEEEEEGSGCEGLTGGRFSSIFLRSSGEIGGGRKLRASIGPDDDGEDGEDSGEDVGESGDSVEEEEEEQVVEVEDARDDEVEQDTDDDDDDGGICAFGTEARGDSVFVSCVFLASTLPSLPSNLVSTLRSTFEPDVCSTWD